MIFIGTKIMGGLKQIPLKRGFRSGTWGMIGAATITTVGGALMGGGGGGDGGGGQGGVVTMPQYSFTEPRLAETSTFLQQGMEALRAGEEAPWLKKYKPIIEGGLREDLATRYFGTPGRRGEGLYGKALETGAITGLGPKATISQGNKALQDFDRKSNQIDQYIAQLYFGAQQQTAMMFPQISTMLPTGPESQAFQGQPVAQRPDYMGSALSDLASNFPWEDMFQPNQPNQPNLSPGVLQSMGGYGVGPMGSGYTNPGYIPPPVSPSLYG